MGSRTDCYSGISGEEEGAHYSGAPPPCGAHSHLSTTPRDLCPRCLLSLPFLISSSLSGSTNFVGASGSGLTRSSPPLRACCCGRSAHSQCPLPIYRSASRGAGAAGGSCWSRSEPALARGYSMRGWVEREVLTTKWLQGSGSCFPGAGLRREEWAGRWASVPPLLGGDNFRLWCPLLGAEEVSLAQLSQATGVR